MERKKWLNADFMNYRQPIFAIICLILLSCSSAAKNEFQTIIARVNKYLSERPTILTSNRIIRDGQITYAYYALKLTKFNLSYDISKTYSSSSDYEGFIIISCNTLDNAWGGDLTAGIAGLGVGAEAIANQASGFSTTAMALNNTDFSSTDKPLTIIVRYSWTPDKWNLTNISCGGMPDSLINDLQTFPQNKQFRQAVAMES